MQVCVCVWWGGGPEVGGVVFRDILLPYFCDRVCLSLNPELIHLAMLADQ